jgi:hypothetical protein
MTAVIVALFVLHTVELILIIYTAYHLIKFKIITYAELNKKTKEYIRTIELAAQLKLGADIFPEIDSSRIRKIIELQENRIKKSVE